MSLSPHSDDAGRHSAAYTAKIFVLYLFLSLANLKAKLLVTPDWFDGYLQEHFARLLAFEDLNNMQSRLLSFYIPKALMGMFDLTVSHAYIVQRLFLVFAAFCCFHLYLKKWFDDFGALACVAFLAALMPLTYEDHIQESAPLLMLTFVLGLWAIREQRPWHFMAVLFVGALNNETMLILPLVYALYHFRAGWKGTVMPLVMSFALAIPAFAVTAVIRYITWGAEHQGGFYNLPGNLKGILWSLSLPWPIVELWGAFYLYFIFIFSGLWVYAYLRFQDKPLFLQRASLMVPVFIAIHLVTGKIEETRQMIPLAFIIIPMGFWYLFPHRVAHEKQDARSAPPWHDTARAEQQHRQHGSRKRRRRR